MENLWEKVVRLLDELEADGDLEKAKAFYERHIRAREHSEKDLDIALFELREALFVHPNFSPSSRHRDLKTSIAIVRDEIGPTVRIEDYFERFDFEACRLEILPSYDSWENSPGLADYLAGNTPKEPAFDEWCSRMAAAKAEGRKYKRLRFVTFPLIDSVRYEIDACFRRSAMAGEEIKYFAHAPVLKGALGTKDFWLFDGKELVILDYRLNGTFCGARLASPELAKDIAAWWEGVFEIAGPIRDLPFWAGAG